MNTPAPVQQKTNTLAIVGFVTSFFFAFIGSILGIVALSQIKASNGTEGGKGLAIAAIIIGFIPVVIIVVLMLLAPVIGSVFQNISGSMY